MGEEVRGRDVSYLPDVLLQLFYPLFMISLFFSTYHRFCILQCNQELPVVRINVVNIFLSLEIVKGPYPFVLGRINVGSDLRNVTFHVSSIQRGLSFSLVSFSFLVLSWNSSPRQITFIQI